MILLIILIIGLIIASFKNKVYGLGMYFLIRLCIPDTCRLGSLSFNTISLAIYVCILLVFYVKKKKWINVQLMFIVILQVPIIFFTAPAGFFMYYMPFYLTSAAMMMLFIIENVNKITF